MSVPAYPRGLPYEAWPPELVQAWEHALAASGFLRRATVASTWSARRRQQVRYDAGRFLAWCLMQGRTPSGLGAAPTPDVLAAFARAEELRGLRLSSIATALGNVVGFLRCIDPAWDPRPAWELVDRIRSHARQELLTPRALAHPEVLYDGGVAWMERCLDAEGQVQDPAGWQQGLMVALLAAAPMRIANFAAIRLGQHLVGGDEGGWQVVLGAEETKSRRVDCWEVPDDLRPYLEHYLGVLRPRMMGRAGHDALWVGAYGQPLGTQGVRQRIVRVTNELCGRPILPHSFRHSAATAFALRHPDRPRDAAALLGHAGPRTTERHYIKGKRQLALRELHKALAKRRAKSDIAINGG